MRGGSDEEDGREGELFDREDRAPLEYGAGDATPAEKIGRLSCTAMDLDLEELRACDSAGWVAGLPHEEEVVRVVDSLGQCGCAILFRCSFTLSTSPR